MWFRLWVWFKTIRKDLILLFIACRNPATPRHLKTLFWGALIYLISPIDFLPDYLPLLGAVDDLTILPAVFYYINRMLPSEVRVKSENSVMKVQRKMPYILTGVAIVLVLWLVFLVWGIYSLLK